MPPWSSFLKPLLFLMWLLNKACRALDRGSLAQGQACLPRPYQVLPHSLRHPVLWFPFLGVLAGLRLLFHITRSPQPCAAFPYSCKINPRPHFKQQQGPPMRSLHAREPQGWSQVPFQFNRDHRHVPWMDQSSRFFLLAMRTLRVNRECSDYGKALMVVSFYSRSHPKFPERKPNSNVWL